MIKLMETAVAVIAEHDGRTFLKPKQFNPEHSLDKMLGVYINEAGGIHPVLRGSIYGTLIENIDAPPRKIVECKIDVSEGTSTAIYVVNIELANGQELEVWVDAPDSQLAERRAIQEAGIRVKGVQCAR